MTTPIVERGQGAADHAPRIEVGAFPPWDTNAYLVWDGRSPEAAHPRPRHELRRPAWSSAPQPTSCGFT